MGPRARSRLLASSQNGDLVFSPDQCVCRIGGGNVTLSQVGL